MVKTIKEIHKNSVCLFKVGNFYHCYDKDAYILSYVFGYKIKSLEGNYKEAGFPIVALNKVIAKLENNKINYIILDKRNDYDVDQEEDYKNLNKYDEFYEKSHLYVNYKARIENINEFLLKNISEKNFRKILGKIENIIYEGREI